MLDFLHDCIMIESIINKILLRCMCLITDSKKKKINCIYFSNMNKKFGEKWKLLIEIS